jgi:hypothetical protein
MKTFKLILSLMIAAAVFSLGLTSCENNNDVARQKDLLPETFRVDIPSSISNSAISGRLSGRAKEDTIQGNDIYQNLNLFVAVGEGASQLVEEFINGIRKYRIDRVQSLTYKSDDDNRTKNLVVESDVAFENKVWDYMLTITDAESESATDGGKALQIFWNNTAPIEGIAIIKPYNCNRVKDAESKDAIFRIDYSEAGKNGYDAEMEVTIAGLPLANPIEDPYSINTLHMFAGKKGETVDVYGNSNHPNAYLFTEQRGFNWAFVASGNESKNIAVAEVGLPPSNLDENDREVLLKEYSIKNVFTNGITAMWPAIDQTVLAAYLKNTAAPGYFNSTGFVKGGTSPGSDWDVLATRLNSLSPYNPKETNDLTLSFK